MEGTALARVSAMNKEELFELIDKGLNLDRETFFREYGLEDYRAEAQEPFKKP